MFVKIIKKGSIAANVNSAEIFKNIIRLFTAAIK